MTRRVLYMVHPVAPSEEEIAAICATPSLCGQCGPGCGGRASALRANLERATRWLSWLRRSFPETTFIAPWIASIIAGDDDSDPKQREAGLIDCCAVVERCDGIVLCGGRLSSGMRREMEHGVHADFARWMNVPPPVIDMAKMFSLQRFTVYDMTKTGGDPPPMAPGQAFARWWEIGPLS